MDGENAEARALCQVVRLSSFSPIRHTVGGMKEQPSPSCRAASCPAGLASIVAEEREHVVDTHTHFEWR